MKPSYALTHFSGKIKSMTEPNPSPWAHRFAPAARASHDIPLLILRPATAQPGYQPVEAARPALEEVLRGQSGNISGAVLHPVKPHDEAMEAGERRYVAELWLISSLPESHPEVQALSNRLQQCLREQGLAGPIHLSVIRGAEIPPHVRWQGSEPFIAVGDVQALQAFMAQQQRQQEAPTPSARGYGTAL